MAAKKRGKASKAADWAAIKHEYQTTDATFASLSERYGIPEGTIKARAFRDKAGRWAKGAVESDATEDVIKAQSARATSRKRERTARVAVALRNSVSSTTPDAKTGHDTPGKCGARKRQGDRSPCQRPAGWGTSHPGTGQCKLHGGCAPVGQPRNTSAVKTGEHKAIYLDLLTGEERQAFESVVTDKLAQLDNEIRLCEFRERWMIERITTLRQAEYTKTNYTEEEEMIAVDPAGRKGVQVVENKEQEAKAREDGLVLVKSTRQVRATYEGTLGQIQAIEEALTRIQARKARLLDLKHKFEGEGKGDTDAVDEFFEALEKVGEVWDGTEV